MLIDNIVQYCDKEYVSLDGNCGCRDGYCNHPSGKCSGSCYDCLYHVHYPDRAPENAKKEYDCPKMLYHYVCQYSYLYATELLCAFEHEWSFIKDFPFYHILSLGCGGCADLMAFDVLRQKRCPVTPFSYTGIDVNTLWYHIHSKIRDYCSNNNIGFQTQYYDVFEAFNDGSITNINIIVISYLLSYLYNTNQIKRIDSLVEQLIKQVIMEKKTPLLLIINDVNSYKRGRNYFSHFENAIRRYGLTINKSEYKYFDKDNLYDGQKIGSPYAVSEVAFNIPDNIQNNYHASISINATVQLLVEVS